MSSPLTLVRNPLSLTRNRTLPSRSVAKTALPECGTPTGAKNFMCSARSGRLWTAPRWVTGGPAQFHRRRGRCLRYRPDGKFLVTANGDGVARVNKLDLCGAAKELLQLAEERSCSSPAPP